MKKIKIFLIKKKIWISFSLIFILVAGLLIWTFTSRSTFIIGGGSTSVQPILEDTAAQYEKEPKGKQKVFYNALGSAAALAGIRSGSYSFGFLSETITDSQAIQLWKENQTLRFVVAKDFVVLIYHLPTGVSLNAGNQNVYSPNTDYDKTNHLNFGYINTENGNGQGTKNILNLYNQTQTWSQVYNGAFSGGNANVKPNCFTREPGSGTRKFFSKHIIHSTTYAFNGVYTSNGGMLEAVEKTPNSIGYVSFSFLKRLISDKEASVGAINIATGQDPKTTLPYDDTKPIDDPIFNKAYTLFRPFTGLISLNANKLTSVEKFIAWLIYPNPALKYEKDGRSALKTNEAAYWYVQNGEDPISTKDAYYKEFNLNDDEAAKFGNNYKSIITLFIEKGFYNKGSSNEIPGWIGDIPKPPSEKLNKVKV